MIKQQGLRPWAVGAVFALSMGVLSSAYGQSASLVPDGPTSFAIGSGGGSESVTFDVNVAGLSPGTVVSSFDFGIIYDPAVMSLSSFSGFGGGLGSPAVDSFEALTTDHLDNTNDSFDNPAANKINSTWDYRAPSAEAGLGNYNGPVLGTPDITAAYSINEGSLRFNDVSLLTESELIALQNPAANDGFTLFSLSFDVDTSQAAGTQILFVDDRSYDGWPNQLPGGELDFKLNDGVTPTYLTLNGSSVRVGSVPVPGTLMLMLVGLWFGYRQRGRWLLKAQSPRR